MIEQTMQDLTPLVGIYPACRAVGVAPATFYRWRRPPAPVAEPRVATLPPRALSSAERVRVCAIFDGGAIAVIDG